MQLQLIFRIMFFAISNTPVLLYKHWNTFYLTISPNRWNLHEQITLRSWGSTSMNPKTIIEEGWNMLKWLNGLRFTNTPFIWWHHFRWTFVNDKDSPNITIKKADLHYTDDPTIQVMFFILSLLISLDSVLYKEGVGCNK